MLLISITADFFLCNEGYFDISQKLIYFLQEVEGHITGILGKLSITQENQR